MLGCDKPDASAPHFRGKESFRDTILRVGTNCWNGNDLVAGHSLHNLGHSANEPHGVEVIKLPRF